MKCRKRNPRTIRLACCHCDRRDMDGITPSKLRKLIRHGWEDVDRYQTYRQACRVYRNPAREPPGYSILDWWTHLGTCPDCVQAGW